MLKTYFYIQAQVFPGEAADENVVRIRTAHGALLDFVVPAAHCGSASCRVEFLTDNHDVVMARVEGTPLSTKDPVSWIWIAKEEIIEEHTYLQVYK